MSGTYSMDGKSQNFKLSFKLKKSMQVFIYCKITLHVSGVCRTHHQEYIKL